MWKKKEKVGFLKRSAKIKWYGDENENCKEQIKSTKKMQERKGMIAGRLVSSQDIYTLYPLTLISLPFLENSSLFSLLVTYVVCIDGYFDVLDFRRPTHFFSKDKPGAHRVLLMKGQRDLAF